MPPAIGHLFIFFGIAMAQAALRCRTSFRVYGWHFAAGAPLRLLWGNLVNWVSTLCVNSPPNGSAGKRLPGGRPFTSTPPTLPAAAPARV